EGRRVGARAVYAPPRTLAWSERHTLVGVSGQVAAVEGDDSDGTRIERVHPGSEDLPLAGRGDGAQVLPELVDVVDHRGAREVRAGKIEIEVAGRELARPGDLPGAQAVAEGEAARARGDLVRQGDLRRAVGMQLEDLRPRRERREVGAGEIVAVAIAA